MYVLVLSLGSVQSVSRQVGRQGQQKLVKEESEQFKATAGQKFHSRSWHFGKFQVLNFCCSSLLQFLMISEEQIFSYSGDTRSMQQHSAQWQASKVRKVGGRGRLKEGISPHLNKTVKRRHYVLDLDNVCE